jgi:twinkle protein
MLLNLSDMQSESEFLRHEPCPNCGSSDALARYTDGHGHCFSCLFYEHGDGSVSTDYHKPQKLMNFTGDFVPLKSRNLREDTLKKFNVRYDHDSKTLRFPYYSQTGQLISFKSRDAEKDFRWTGKNEDHTLFGQQLWGRGKEIVITEGELDCLSVFQIRPTWPVVSLPNGAAAAKKALQHQLKWLMGFETIILFFDNDDAGQQAAQDCASLFPHDKLFIARLDSYKDANEALIAKDYEAITSAILWNKKPYSPKTVIDGRDLFSLATKPLHGRDANWPFAALDSITGGLRKGELVTITAGSGVGKSTFCGEIAQALIDQGEKVGYIALEESLQRTALRLMSVKANKPLHLNNELPQEDLKRAFDASLGTGSVYLRDGFGSVDPDSILSDCRFMALAKEVGWIILDHLSILMSGNESHDERKLIDVTMTKLRSFVEETGIGMLLISHLKRPQGDKGHEDGQQVSLGQLRGSHSIVQLSDMVIALERNLSAGDNMANIRVLKNRFNGQTGQAGAIAFNQTTGRMTEDLSPAFKSKPNKHDDDDDYGS